MKRVRFITSSSLVKPRLGTSVGSYNPHSSPRLLVGSVQSWDEKLG